MTQPPNPAVTVTQADETVHVRASLDAYYYAFEPTGVADIDRILGAVAYAGKAYHHTEDWDDASIIGVSCVENIQRAANLAARHRQSIPVAAGVGEGLREALEKLRKESGYASEGPWQVDSEWNADGAYGGGPDHGTGYYDYLILDAQGHSLLGSENGTAKSIEVEYDEDGGTAWDQVGLRNAAFAAACVNFVRAALSTPPEPARDALLLGGDAMRKKKNKSSYFSSRNDEIFRNLSTEPPLSSDQLEALGLPKRNMICLTCGRSVGKPRNEDIHQCACSGDAMRGEGNRKWQQAIGAEIERQCSIGAGTCGTLDDGSGLFEVHASLDLNGFAEAMMNATKYGEQP